MQKGKQIKPATLTPEELEAQKSVMYDKLSPRRRRFIGLSGRTLQRSLKAEGTS